MSLPLEQSAVAELPDRLKAGGDGGNLLALHLMGLLLTMVTLGIYRFWWRTNARRYLWSSLSYKGDPFEYTGKGLELFLGFLIVLFLVVAPLSGLYFFGYWLLKSGETVIGITIMAGIYIGMFALFGAAIYRVMVYRLSRTRWRGIRAALGGSSWRYTGLYLWCLLLQIVTLGFAAPYASIRLNGYMLNNAWFGSGRFAFQADWKPLMKYYVVPGAIQLASFAVMAWGFYVVHKASPEGGTADYGMLWTGFGIVGVGLLILIAGLIGMFWYSAALLRTLAAGTTFEGVRFRAPIGGGRLCRFVIGNALLVIVTQYIAYPWVQLRILRLVAETLEIHGEPDFAAIAQNTSLQPRFGEGLGEAFL